MNGVMIVENGAVEKAKRDLPFLVILEYEAIQALKNVEIMIACPVRTLYLHLRRCKTFALKGPNVKETHVSYLLMDVQVTKGMDMDSTERLLSGVLNAWWMSVMKFFCA